MTAFLQAAQRFLLLIGLVKSVIGFAAFVENRSVPDFDAINVTGPFYTIIEVNDTAVLANGAGAIINIEANLANPSVSSSIHTDVSNRTLNVFLSPPYKANDDRFTGLIRIKIITRNTFRLYYFSNGGSGSGNSAVVTSFGSMNSQGSGTSITSFGMFNSF